LPDTLTANIASLAQLTRTTVFDVLLAGFVALLHRYTSHSDIAIGTTISGRTIPASQPLIGAIADTLVLRTKIESDNTFAETLHQVRRCLTTAIRHQGVSFAEIVKTIAPDRDPSRPPLYQIGFHLAPAGKGILASQPISTGAIDLDLNLTVAHVADRSLCLTIQYSLDLFDAPTIHRLAAAYLRLLRSSVDDSTTTVSRLRVLPEAECQQLLAWSGRHRCYPDLTLHEAVLEQAAASQYAPACGYGGRWLTYQDLVGEAGRIARWLHSTGVRPGTVVGVCLARDPALLPALLGVLMAGCAYLPMEPSHPTERLKGMLCDAGVRQVVTTSLLADHVPVADDRTILTVDTCRAAIAAQSPTPPAVSITPDSLAYVMFTSGSTGHPRGAGITHRAIINRLYWMQEELPLEHADRVLHKTPYTFDVSVWELFWPLIAGAGVVIAASGGHKDPEYLARLIDRERVTVAHFVPSMLEEFLEHPELLGLDRVICSGEVLRPQLAARCFERLPGVRLYNLYGPTEAAIDVSWHLCVPGEQRVPIGRPVPNTRFEVLDRHRQRVPIGAIGELYVGGVQLARGYVGQPALTGGRFVQDPFGAPGTRLYRTGDLVRWRADGEVEFIGRDDDQVKIRGVRIEPGEIRDVLERHLNVDRAVVTFREDAPGGPGLVAYVRWTGTPDSFPEVLKQHLLTKLPKSLLPTLFVQLSDFPVLPNGKLDHAALPPPVAGPVAPSGYVAPRTSLEATLCDIWAVLLGRPDVGIADNFFALGGDSLLALQLIDQIDAKCGVTIPLRRCFELGTVADYALAILDLHLQRMTYDVDLLIAAIQTGSGGA
ncbi:MAG: amino acid adenylation domain-containing protein, partial [Micromonosporaceae bacterium]|nr:amino acid adenylation domain-containing protein [Micromonosporaceae bacterium]